jgi:hypothetical protein
LLFAESGVATLFPGGLLGELRRASSVLLSEQEQRQQEILRRKAQFDASLRRIFAFLRELVEQLNILKPDIPRAYPLAESQEFTGLSWQEGHVDYRSSAMHAETTALESVSFTYRLASSLPPLVVARDGGVSERFRKRLFDEGLVCETKEFRDAGCYLEKVEFLVYPDIKVQTIWRGNLKDGGLYCESRNLERLGRNTWRFAADAPMRSGFLDAFGNLVMGMENGFPFSFRLQQPECQPVYSEPER